MSKKKAETIAERMALAASWSTEMPPVVWRLLACKPTAVSYAGDEVSFGEGDYADIHEWREAITWLVDQFGGKVEWDV